MPSSEDVLVELKQVYDPEIPVNIVDLGLVYDVAVENTACRVTMTLTSQACPEAQAIPEMVRQRIVNMDGIDDAQVDVVWEPQWSPQLISSDGRNILGIEEPPAEETPSADAPPAPDASAEEAPATE